VKKLLLVLTMLALSACGKTAEDVPLRDGQVELSAVRGSNVGVQTLAIDGLFCAIATKNSYAPAISCVPLNQVSKP
jgi:hypothetical protein